MNLPKDWSKPDRLQQNLEGSADDAKHGFGYALGVIGVIGGVLLIAFAILSALL